MRNTLPTKQQIEAYRLVRIHGMTQMSAAVMMQIDSSTVNKTLKRLESNYMNDEKLASPNFISYCQNMDNKIVRKF